jgi:hypothetical protein
MSAVVYPATLIAAIEAAVAAAHPELEGAELGAAVLTVRDRVALNLAAGFGVRGRPTTMGQRVIDNWAPADVDAAVAELVVPE